MWQVVPPATFYVRLYPLRHVSHKERVLSKKGLPLVLPFFCFYPFHILNPFLLYPRFIYVTGCNDLSNNRFIDTRDFHDGIYGISVFPGAISSAMKSRFTIRAFGSMGEKLFPRVNGMPRNLYDGDENSRRVNNIDWHPVLLSASFSPYFLSIISLIPDRINSLVRSGAILEDCTVGRRVSNFHSPLVPSRCTLTPWSEDDRCSLYSESRSGNAEASTPQTP